MPFLAVGVAAAYLGSRDFGVFGRGLVGHLVRLRERTYALALRHEDDLPLLRHEGREPAPQSQGDGTGVQQREDGGRTVRFFYEGVFEDVLDRLGQMPLPPYIHEKLEDKTRYQTVYAKVDGSAAAPTAGLHFTPELLEKIKRKGIDVVPVLLHVGLGTFRPVKEEDVADHHMHSEYYEVTPEQAAAINAARARGGRIVCVGTTSVRTLETVSTEDGIVHPGSGFTQIFITPGVKIKAVDALITNFHLPQSTLLMLISALMGRENALAVYKQAVEERYRFFSFGDAMMITGESKKNG